MDRPDDSKPGGAAPAAPEADSFTSMWLMLIGLVAAAGAGGWLAEQAAPDSESVSVFAGAAMVFAYGMATKAMFLYALFVLLPLRLLGWAASGGRRSMSEDAARDERQIGGAFCIGFALLAALIGIGVGLFPGGWGVLTTAAAYFVAATVIGLFVRVHVVRAFG